MNSDTVPISLKRGMQILRAFRGEDVMLGNSEIVDRTGLAKSTVARFTHTLCELGYLRQEDRLGRYSLGDMVVPIGKRVLSTLPIRQVAGPLMQDFAEHFGVSVVLGTGEMDNVVFLVCRQGEGAGIKGIRDGSIIPMMQAGLGAAFLWSLPPARRAYYIAQVASEVGDAANKWISNLDQSFSELDRDGFMRSREEWRHGSYSSITAPLVLGHDSNLLALSCFTHSSGFSDEKFAHEVGSALVKLSTAIANTVAAFGVTFWDD